MKKLSIAEASKYFNVSKEAIHNRIRRGTLNSVTKDGVKFVLITQDSKTDGSDKFYEYLEQESERLREKVEAQEREILRLRDLREQMLVAEKLKIEQIYKERDEQLTTVLNAFASKLLPAQSEQSFSGDAVTAEVIDTSDEPSVEIGSSSDLVSLKHFLKLKQYSKKRCSKIKKRFKRRAGTDERIIVIDKKLYLRPYHFNYKTLLDE